MIRLRLMIELLSNPFKITFKWFIIVRLNSDKFFVFLWAFCFIFLTNSNDRQHETIGKNVLFFSNIPEYPWFFGIFVHFLAAYAMRSTAQIRDIPQKIRLDLLHLLMYHSNRGGSWGGCQGAKILFLRRLKLRRFDQNQGNHPFKKV